MQKIKIYCNYGVLGAEKRKMYTYGAPDSTATCWDELEAEIPDGWELFENREGDTMVTAPWGWDYDINDVLAGKKYPCFYAYDKNGDERIVSLKNPKKKEEKTGETE